MPKLPFLSHMQLLDAFQKGTQFELFGIPVTDMYEMANGVLRVYFGPFRYLDGLNPDGTHPQDRHVRMMMTKLPVEPEPFLKRFVCGEPAYCPATEEVVESVSFYNNELVVTLVNGDGVSRESLNYKHTGQHKHNPALSLVFGKPPVKPRSKTYDVFDLLDSAPAGLYSWAAAGNQARIAVLGAPDNRSVLYLEGDCMEPLNPDHWEEVAFKLTNNFLVFEVRG